MHEQRHAPRRPHESPVTFSLDGKSIEAKLVNLSSTGALVRFDGSLPIGPEAVGRDITFTSWHDVGALLRPQATAVRFFEDPEGKLLAVRYLSEDVTSV